MKNLQPCGPCMETDVPATFANVFSESPYNGATVNVVSSLRRYYFHATATNNVVSTHYVVVSTLLVILRYGEIAILQQDSRTGFVM
jgi:hypothetical protein